ncbi:hypothetical protein GLOIN_2v1485609 [Rhizophagus clarus]|nr:hypothetical protein GLOIN_2v1485609 [Rhizophagus clarus]
MLQHNGYPPEAFFMGALKCRDIEGNIVDPNMPVDEDTRDEVNSVLNDDDDDDGDDEDVEKIEEKQDGNEDDDDNETASVTSRSTDKVRKRKGKKKINTLQFEEMEDGSSEKNGGHITEDEVDDVSVAKTNSDDEQDIIDLLDEYNEEKELESYNRKRSEYPADDEDESAAASSSKSTHKRSRMDRNK